MMLRDELYTITASHLEGQTASYTLRLHPDSVIYKAHFPGQPITPGVCIIRTAVELAEIHFDCPLTLFVVKNVKFLSVISPEETKEVVCRLYGFKEEADMLSFQCVVTANNAVHAKMSLSCKKK